ncbi:ABC transporter substrate-binding protein [Halococcus hamelinensis]|uniref:Fe3+-hydroxamate ABC transporter substrate-binding protein n=1 Tax=Halococcus hamelinensis 100A6 TaxID=1132509 RepID=M0M5Z2_9EURY|nr:ABC transporter substrate-binding protein [Halococcus hamelinensis]EMA41237.1 Fe3+-hydroxamate ABC transporter substrate-binding protein [Halococcus hamelinensis 100A6]
MARDAADGSTRRRFLKTGVGVGLAGLFAGCSSGNDAGSNDTSGAGDGADATSATAGGSTAGKSTDGATSQGGATKGGGTTTGGSYSVSMAPVGSVTFDSVPRKWVPFTGDYADMGVALGRSDGLSAIGVAARYGSFYYDDLPGVSVDTSSLTELYQGDSVGKEVFYEIDADVHVVDPNFMVNRLGWSQGDVTEITNQVAPFFGNTTFTRVYDWHDYRYYTMEELLGKLGAVFDQRARAEAFTQLLDEVHSTVKGTLPNETPSVALLYPADVPPESFYPYLVGEGTTSKQWRTLEVEDALAANDVADAQAGGSAIDFETLLEIDPDVLAVRLQGEITDQYFRKNVVRPLENHEVASQLSAVQNDRVVYAGLTYQGPIIYLFQLERAAQGVYPDAFGGSQLFDRQRVADIVNGDG